MSTEVAALLERVDFLKAENQRQATGWAADKVRANVAEARLAAVDAVASQIESDDRESLATFGQHLNGAVVTCAEMIRAALSSTTETGATP